MYRDELIRFIDDRRDEMVKELSGFVAVPSVSADAAQVQRALAFILDLARRQGLFAEAQLDGQVGVIECGEGPETLGILSHVDVVPPGDPADWASDPFQVDLRDGKLFGRGTIDDKGPVIAALYALLAVKSLGLPLRKRVQIILGTQEEVEWTDMDAYVKACKLPDYGFTPDDAFPICNIEKGCGAMTLRIPIDAPDGGVYITGLRAGSAFNAVPDVAEAELSDGSTVGATGRATHACQPEKGSNALMRLCDQLLAMEAEGKLRENAALRFCRLVKARFPGVYGEGMGLYSESEYYEGEFVHRNTITPTWTFMADGELVANFDVRFPYGCDVETIRAAFRALAADAGGRLEPDRLRPAVFVPSSSPFLHAMADAYEAMTSYKNEYTIAYGGSYAKAMPNVVAWGPLFPDDEDTCHEVNEYIRAEALFDCAKIFAAAIAGIVLSEKSFK